MVAGWKKKKENTDRWLKRKERKRMHLKACYKERTRDGKRYSDRLIKEVHFHADTVRRRCEGCGFDTSWHSWLMSPVFFFPFTPFSSSDCRQVQSSNHLLPCLPPSWMLIAGETHCNEDIVVKTRKKKLMKYWQHCLHLFKLPVWHKKKQHRMQFFL